MLIPLLARRLGPESWGEVLLAQAVGIFLTLVVEFGFDLSATREVARHQHDRVELRRILGSVTGLKMALAGLAGSVALLANLMLGAPISWPLLLGALMWGVFQAFAPLWFFQGLERVGFAVTVDLVARAASVVLVFLVVQGPSDAWLVLPLQGLGGGAAVVVLHAMAWRTIGGAVLRGPRDALRWGLPLFLFRAMVSLYTTVNTLILGGFAPTAAVAHFGGADRVARSAQGLLQPASLAFFPRLASLLGTSRKDARRLARLSFVAMALGGLFLSVCLYVLAPWIVAALLGPGYEPAVRVLRILSPLPFLGGMSNALGIQWMLPLGMDRAFNAIIALGAALNLALVFGAGAQRGATGIAWCIIATEAFVVAAMLTYLRAAAADPFRGDDHAPTMS